MNPIVGRLIYAGAYENRTISVDMVQFFGQGGAFALVKVAVDGQRYAGIGMAQTVSYVDRAEAGIDEQAGVGVAQVVQADFFQSSGLQALFQGEVEHVAGVWEDAVLRFGGEFFEVFEHGGQKGRHDDDPLAGTGLACGHDILPMQAGEGFADGDGVTGEVNIRPGQRQ